MKTTKTYIINYVLLFLILISISLCFGNQMKVNLADTKSELYKNNIELPIGSFLL